MLVGKQVVENRENRFFDFTRVPGAADQYQLFAEVDDHKGFGIGAVNFRHRFEAGQSDDGERRGVVLQFFPVPDLDEHVAGEQALPGQLRDHSDMELIVGIGAAQAILHVQFLPLHVGQHARVQRVELVDGKRFVDFAPPDVVLAGGFLHDEFVVGGAAGMFAGFHANGSQVGNNPLLVPYNLFV